MNTPQKHFVQIFTDFRATLKEKNVDENYWYFWIDILMNISTYTMNHSIKYFGALRDYQSKKPFSIRKFAELLGVNHVTLSRAFTDFQTAGILKKVDIDGAEYYAVSDIDDWFYIPEKVKIQIEKQKTPEKENELYTSKEQQVQDWLYDFGINDNLCCRYTENEDDIPYIEEIIKYAIKKEAQGKVKHLGAYIRKMIEDNWGDLKNWNMDKEEKRLARKKYSSIDIREIDDSESLWA